MRNTLIFISLLLIVTFSCTSPKSSEPTGEEIPVDTADIIEIPVDTTAADTFVVLDHRLASAEEAMKFMQESGNWQEYGEGLFPKIVEENLDYVARLLRSKYRRFIIVDKQSMHVVLYDHFGREEKCYKMACAKNYGTKLEKGDSRTPEGFFSVENVYDSTDWLFTDDNGVTSQVKGQFGPRFIRLRIPTTSQIGIHGTRAPWALGSRASHGCIRIHNDNIMELVDLVEPGMPVIVSPGARDVAQNTLNGVDIPRVDIGKVRYRPINPQSLLPPDTTKVDTVQHVNNEVIADTISIPDSVYTTTEQPTEQL